MLWEQTIIWHDTWILPSCSALSTALDTIVSCTTFESSLGVVCSDFGVVNKATVFSLVALLWSIAAVFDAAGWYGMVLGLQMLAGCRSHRKYTPSKLPKAPLRVLVESKYVSVISYSLNSSPWLLFRRFQTRAIIILVLYYCAIMRVSSRINTRNNTSIVCSAQSHTFDS